MKYLKNEIKINRVLITLVLLVLNLSCVENKTELAQASKITVKYSVLNEEISPNFINCSDKSIPFSERQENDCSFSIGNYEFDIKEKYLIDERGNLKEYWRYLSEGPLTYTIDELNQDLKFKNSLNIDDFKVGVANNGSEIIDSKDTLKIERVFKSAQLILMVNEKNNDRRIFYEYN